MAGCPAPESVGIGCDHLTITDAIAAAAPGSTIAIQPGTYYENLGTLDKRLTFSPAVECVADRETGGVIIDGAGSRVASVEATVTFLNMELRGGNEAEGGVLQVEGDGALTLCDVDVTRGTAFSGGWGAGGGIWCDGGELSLTGATSVHGNWADMGGGIAGRSCDISLLDQARVGNNFADSGGGFYVQNSTVEIRGSNNAVNTNDAIAGGGFYVFLSTLEIEPAEGGTALVSYNDATGDGGGVFNYQSDVIARGDVRFVANEATGDGGAVFADEGLDSSLSSLELSGGVWVTGNSAENGGGVALERVRDVLFLGALIDENTARSRGGGIYGATHRAVEIVNTVLDANVADEGGGGYFDASHDVRVGADGETCTPNYPTSVCSAVTNNRGGGLWFAGDAVGQIGQTVLSGNDDGAALQVDAGASASVDNSLFADNAGEGVVVEGAVEIYAATIAGSGDAAIDFAAGSSGTVEQSVLQDNGAPVTIAATATVDLRCNNLAPVSGAPATDVDNQNAPTGLFVDPAGGDYRIAATSASADACDPTTYNDHRPDLNDAPASGWMDQGAFEVQ